MKLNDEQLVAKARDGDASAYEALFERYQTGIYNFAYSIVRNTEDAKDLAQEAFIKVFKALPKLAEEAKFSSYLYRTVRNLALDELKRQAKFGSSSALDFEKDPNISADPQRSVLLKEQQVQVRKAAAQLPEDYRMALFLKELQDMSYDEISSVMDMPKGSVGVLLLRARMRLKEEIRMSQVDVKKLEKECRAVLPLLSAYLDDELYEAERQKVKEHLGECPNCRLAVEEMAEASKSYRALIPLVPPVAVRENVLPRINKQFRASKTKVEQHATKSGELAQRMTKSHKLSPRGIIQRFVGLPLTTKVTVTSLALLVVCGVVVGGYVLSLSHSPGETNSKLHTTIEPPPREKGEVPENKKDITPGGTGAKEWEEGNESSEQNGGTTTPGGEQGDETELIRQAIITKIIRLGLKPEYYNVTNIVRQGNDATGDAVSKEPYDESIHFELNRSERGWVVTNYTYYMD